MDDSQSQQHDANKRRDTDSGVPSSEGNTTLGAYSRAELEELERLLESEPPPPLALRSVSIDWARFFIVGSLLAIFLLTLAATFASAMLDLHWQNSKEVFQVALSTEGALLGTAVGFYYRQDK